MAVREFKYRGKSLEELQQLSLQEFAQLLPARQRRSLTRGFTEAQQAFVRKLQKKGDNLETHCREMIIIPQMVGKTIKVHTGKEFAAVRVEMEMLGHRLGEYADSRKRIAHSAPGVGATRSSAAISVR